MYREQRVAPKATPSVPVDDHFFTYAVFIAPLLSNTVHESPERSDSCTVQVLGLILELLSFFVEHHTYHIKNYILHKGIR